MQDESVIINQLKGSSRLAFSMLYEKYSAEMYSLSFKYLLNRELAEDAVHNVFLKIWDNRALLDESETFNRYLFTILKNHLLNTLRDNTKRVCNIDDLAEALQPVVNNADQELLAREQSSILSAAIEQLSPQKRTIVRMKAEGNQSNQEIADKLNLSVNTVKFQYSQSIKQLRKIVRNLSIVALGMM